MIRRAVRAPLGTATGKGGYVSCVSRGQPTGSLARHAGSDHPNCGK